MVSLIFDSFYLFQKLVLSDEGEVFLWGSNESRQLGFATDGGGEVQWSPKKLPFGIRIADVAGGRSHTVLVTETGHTYTWGAQAWGQLGKKYIIFLFLVLRG